VATSPIAKPWTFSQASQKRPDMTLSGSAAPFGRPRQGALVNAGVTIRRSITRYPDGNTGPSMPTVHAFGVEPKSFEIHGRWMDRSLGAPGLVRQMQRQWVDFISDKDLVSARWGDILSYVIFIHDIDLHFESEFEIVWSLKADVLRDDQASVPDVPAPTKTPADYAKNLSDKVAPFVNNNLVPPNLRSFLGTLSDQIDLVVASIQAPFAAVYSTATAIGDFETALSSDLVKMASGLQTVKSGVLALRDMSEFALAQLEVASQQNADLVLAAAQAVGYGPTVQTFANGLLSGPDQINLAAQKAQQDLDAENLLLLIADMQNDIRSAQRGDTASAYAAQTGDTWESIATRAYGGPGSARSIRSMNGIRYGERPQPGKIYQLPRTP
jgi:hypothetical protein